MRENVRLLGLTGAVALVALTLASAALGDAVYGDVGIASVTADVAHVAHVRVGESVTFAVVEENFGPIAAELNMQGLASSTNLQLRAVDCLGPSNDGAFCEYGVLAAGSTVTARYTFTVLAAARTATFTPCVTDEESPLGFPFFDTNPGNNCVTASVRVIGRI